MTLLVVTSLSMIFGELVPKNLAVARPLQTARAVAGLQLLFSWLMTWPIRLTNGVANWVLRKLGIEPAQELRSARSAQELVSLVRNSARSGSLDPATAALLDRSLQFGDLTAEELMTPRSKIVALQVDNTVADLVEAAAESGFSRFPVVDGDLDETVGIVHVKQVFGVPAAERELTLVTAVAQPVAKVPSTLDGDALMGQIRANDLQTAMVVDEYGGTAGMVTVEDLIEEIVGDVRDEHDDASTRMWWQSATVGGCPVCCASTRWPPRPATTPPRANTRRSVGWSCNSWAAFRPSATRCSWVDTSSTASRTPRPGGPECFGWTAAASTCSS